MGCSGSTTAGGAGNVDRNTYHERHPGVHNKPTGGIESEVTDRTKPFPADDKTLIEVSKVDLAVKSNAKAHHTDEYDITETQDRLVIRRGQEFNINVEFNRPYDSNKDDLRIVFQFGNYPKPSRGTHAEFILSDRDVPKEWGAYIKTKEGNSLSLVMNTPPTCAVGKWSLKIDVVKRSENNVEVFRYKHPSDIYILFNPWCRDDLVYMIDEKLLGEYILKETGYIYAGSADRISPKPWAYSQFEGVVLDCAIQLLDRSYLPDHLRWNPIMVVRIVSKMVNAQDDGGVLVGNWSSKYDGGTSPLDWTGSEAILEQYYTTGRSVSYGQCWVFSGVVTTVCRALGIPTRSVTNFSSAHDTEGSITIDYHFDHKGNYSKELTDDSVWNFHVWNDVWLARPDLPPGYGGWQAIDATPQETSDGVYCMGPMSIFAVKRGEVLHPYDGQFLFAEVNADKVYWKHEEDGTKNVIRVKKYGVGQYISTKLANKPEREDVTDQYKFREGTEEERAAVRQANLASTRPGVYESKAEDVEFYLKPNHDIFMGDTIKFSLVLKNTSDNKRTVHGHLTLSSTTYTGVLHQKIRDRNIDKTILQPKEEESIDMEVEVNEYLDKLTDHCICKIACMCIVDETKQTFADMEELRLRKPHLAIKAPQTCKLGQTFEAEVSFANPLPVPLTKCTLRVEGPGLQRPVIYKQPNVDAKAKYSGKFEMTPKKRGTRDIIVYFNCDQINSVNVSHEININ
ncbi:protein-glutamine gamma-glutamyltransferase K-like isoform X1 [Mercenaria mercenaria]|uniref:protein-glutamine gamma-glutamyltransferase K-like isoform X1 n=1 Tax=Mercenaria mercenaria TaxID=6596 RepID=UPI00234E54A1|nr:protein-glutamine gamma-glutamyltransferase K-like isoform X1 [Mercenaria mercenaria]XP_053401509.1 protein-glutamine gamma-glutamyltransferase K-like isoform X1 [Mercenaria mercenaria]